MDAVTAAPAPAPASTCTSMLAMPAGGVRGRWPAPPARRRPGRPEASRSTSPTARRPGRASDGGGSSPTSSAGASSSSTPPATASALPGPAGPGRRVVQPATPGAGPGPHHHVEHARAGRAALDQAPRRVGRHLRRRDHLSVLPDPGTPVDRQQPLRPGSSPPACRCRWSSAKAAPGRTPSVDSSSLNPRWVISNTASASTRNSDAAWAICSSSWGLLWVLRTSRSTP